jgi:hypothetical protein
MILQILFPKIAKIPAIAAATLGSGSGKRKVKRTHTNLKSTYQALDASPAPCIVVDCYGGLRP